MTARTAMIPVKCAMTAECESIPQLIKRHSVQNDCLSGNCKERTAQNEKGVEAK